MVSKTTVESVDGIKEATSGSLIEDRPHVVCASDSLPALKFVKFPQIQPVHQFHLADQGWSTITFDEQEDQLFQSYQVLLQACKVFFDQPESYKESYKSNLGSEEGWSRVEGEKEFITLRTLQNTPEELRAAAKSFWHQAAALLQQLLRRISESLDLEAKHLTIFSKPCLALSDTRVATMLRLFRYEAASGDEDKLVAERGCPVTFQSNTEQCGNWCNSA